MSEKEVNVAKKVARRLQNYRVPGCTGSHCQSNSGDVRYFSFGNWESNEVYSTDTFGFCTDCFQFEHGWRRERRMSPLSWTDGRLKP